MDAAATERHILYRESPTGTTSLPLQITHVYAYTCMDMQVRILYIYISHHTFI